MPIAKRRGLQGVASCSVAVLAAKMVQSMPSMHFLMIFRSRKDLVSLPSCYYYRSLSATTPHRYFQTDHQTETTKMLTVVSSPDVSGMIIFCKLQLFIFLCFKNLILMIVFNKSKSTTVKKDYILHCGCFLSSHRHVHRKIEKLESWNW